MTNKAIWRLVLRLVAVAGVVLLFWFVGPEIWYLFSPFLIAFPIAAALQRPIRWTEKRMRLKHGAAVGIWVFLVCVVMALLLYWMATVAFAQIIQVGNNAPATIGDIIATLRDVNNQVFDTLDYLPQTAEAWAQNALNEGLTSLGATATSWLTAVFNFAIGFASGIPYGLIYVNFLIFGIYFFASQYEQMKRRMVGMMSESARERAVMLSNSAGQGIWGYVKVQTIYGILVMVVSFPVISLFGVPYAFLVAFLAAILEFLPIFGNGTLYIPWAIICYIIGRPTLGTQMLVLHLVLFTFRRMTEPKLLSNQIGLSPLLSLISMFAGMQMAGVLGLIFAPVLLVVLQSAWIGGLFTTTVEDIRCVVRHVHGLLGGNGSGGEDMPRPQTP